MALSVTRARVKEKCGVTGSTYDATIDSLISEIVPTVEFAVRPEHLADTANSGLQATLNLSAAELVCAEFLEQLWREPGAAEAAVLGELSLTPSDAPAKALRGSAWRRLRPYLKSDPSEKAKAQVAAAAGKNEEAES
jgi:hypothetical protein